MANTGIKMGIPAILLLIIGIFLIVLGIKGILDYNSTSSELKRAIVSLFGGGKKDAISLIIAILLLSIIKICLPSTKGLMGLCPYPFGEAGRLIRI